MYNIRNDTIRLQIHDILFDGKSNVCSISLHFRDIRKTNKTSNFDLENEGQNQRGENGTYVIRM